MTAAGKRRDRRARPLRPRRCLIHASAAALALTWISTPAAAQIIVDGTLNNLPPAALPASGGVFQITPDLGRVAGSNLFHSFQTFDLATGQTAVFTGPADIRNIIARVTGGSTSTIDGTIDASSFPSANFYFVNPAGVIFGPGSAVNVTGSFFVSTASRIAFGDGGTLSMAATPTGTLSMADPVAFGFVGGNAAITFNGAGVDDLGVGHTATNWSSGAIRGPELSVSAGNVAFNNFGFQLSGGAAPAQIDIAAVGTSATSSLLLGQPATALRAQGQLVIVGDPHSSWSTTSGAQPGGGIFLSGGGVRLQGVGATPTSVASLSFATDGGGIGVASSGDLLLSGTLLSSSSSNDRAAGTIDVTAAGAVTLSNSTGLAADALGTGAGGTINLQADSIMLADQSFIAADSFGTGAAGHVWITATNGVALGGTSSVSADSGDGQTDPLASMGDAGTVSINAGQLQLTQSAGIKTDSFATGSAGGVTLNVHGLSLAGQSYIASDAFAAGSGGSIDVTATIAGLADASAIKSDNYGARPGGNINLNLGSLSLADDALIATDNFGSGSGGDIVIAVAGGAALSDRSAISSNSGDVQSSPLATLGAAGDISVKAISLALSDSAGIKSNAFGAGAAGTIRFDAGTLTLTGNSYLASDTFGTGSGGNIEIAASGKLLLSDDSVISADALLQRGPHPTIFDTQSGQLGASGGVTISADSVQLSDSAGIRTSTDGARNAGTVAVTANRLSLGDQSFVASDANGAGKAGSVDIVSTDSVALSGLVYLGARSRGSGGAGHVSIASAHITLADHAQVSSEALGTGAAGDVSLTGFNQLSLTGGAHISSSSTQSISSTAGTITIAGNMGATLSVNGGSSIETDSASAATAGNISISSDTILVDGAGSAISSVNSASNGGAAGRIAISTDPLTVSNGGRITTNAVSGAAGNISLTFPNTGLLFLQGTTAPGVIATSSGTNSGGVIRISNPLAIISNGGEIVALGQIRSASVDIVGSYFIRSGDRANVLSVDGNLVVDSQIEDVSRGTSEIEARFVDARQVLSGRCASAEASGVASQLAVTAVGPYPATPAKTACGRRTDQASPTQSAGDAVDQIVPNHRPTGKIRRRTGASRG